MSGYVLSKLWLWLIVPTFHVDAITIAQALGLSSVVQFLLLGVTMNMKSDVDTNSSFMAHLLGKFLSAIVIYSFSLLMGYIYSLYI